MDSKENFNTVITLVARQPWIATKISALSHMLYEECACVRSREMLIKIISNFFYLSTEEYNLKLEGLAKEIMGYEGYAETGQLVAMAADSGSDSSHAVLYNLKYIFIKEGWLNFPTVAFFGSAYKKYKTTGRRNIIVVDDFVGSGRTVVSRYKELVRVFANSGVADFSIKFKVLVSTRSGLEHAQSQGVDITAQCIIDKAIDGFFSEVEAEEYRLLMLNLEAGLSQTYEGTELPSMGFGGAQAAYCREHTNSPNSVFPIFWWPINSALEQRPTILHRAMGDA